MLLYIGFFSYLSSYLWIEKMNYQKKIRCYWFLSRHLCTSSSNNTHDMRIKVYFTSIAIRYIFPPNHHPASHKTSPSHRGCPAIILWSQPPYWYSIGVCNSHFFVFVYVIWRLAPVISYISTIYRIGVSGGWLVCTVFDYSNLQTFHWKTILNTNLNFFTLIMCHLHQSLYISQCVELVCPLTKPLSW